MSDLFQKVFFCKPYQCADNDTQDLINSQTSIQDVDDPDLYDAEYMSPAMAKRPPNFETLLNTVKSITKKVEIIQGFKFELSTVFSQNFQLTHAWQLVPAQGGQQSQQKMMKQMQNPQKIKKSNYLMSVQYIGGQIRSFMDQPKYILTARLDTEGKLDAAIIKRFNDNVQFRFSAQYPQGLSNLDYVQMSFDLDIEGDDFLHTLKYGSGIISGNMMQKIGKNLTLGFEMMNLPERKMNFFNYAAKYQKKKSHWFAQYYALNDGLTLAYIQYLKKNSFLLSELELNTKEMETICTLGYKYRFSQSEIVSTLTSQGKVSTLLSILSPAFQLKLSGEANFLKDSYKFGYGFFMGQYQ